MGHSRQSPFRCLRGAEDRPTERTGRHYDSGRPPGRYRLRSGPHESRPRRAQLRAAGFDAWSLAGGMRAWSLAWSAVDVPQSDSGVSVLQIRRMGKGCLSYLIGDGGEAAVIDASVDPDVYIALARERGWTISRVLDTHIHADHLSRSRALAVNSGATLHLPMQTRVAFPFEALREGDALSVGDAWVLALATPGHTMESMTYQLDNAALFSGDTLFLSSVGRPDLEASPEEARGRARLLARSLQRLVSLPGDLQVLPGHTSEPIPFDRRPLARRLSLVREGIKLLRLTEDDFVATITSRLPVPPANHGVIVTYNEAGELPPDGPADLEAGANRCAVG